MRRVIRVFMYLVVTMLFTLATISCANLPWTKKPQPKVETKPQTSPTPKPTPKATPKPAPKTTPKPTPTPVNLQPLIEQGQAHRRAGKYPAAIAAFEEALKVDPKQAEATKLLQEIKTERDDLVAEHIKKGLKYNAEENLQAAMQEWNKALELDPKNTEVLNYKEQTQRKLDAFKK